MPKRSREINDQLSEARVKKLIMAQMRKLGDSSDVTYTTITQSTATELAGAGIQRFNPSDPTRRVSEAQNGIIHYPDTTVLDADLAPYELLADYQKVRQFSEAQHAVLHYPDTVVHEADLDLSAYELLVDYQKVRQFSEPGVGITHIPAAATGGDSDHDGLEWARRMAL
jgi:uncharacterized Zn-binding protein involved in type VI secretion